IKALTVRLKAFGRRKRDPAIPDPPQLLLLFYTAGVLRSSFSHFLACSRDRSIWKWCGAKERRRRPFFSSPLAFQRVARALTWCDCEEYVLSYSLL
ncbi:unnamed protein product, partial [Musa acuminata subsp. burmannicoides]